jgi:hypothetical protein
MAAALLMLGYTGLKNIFETTDPIAVVEEAEWQIVTGFSPEVIEMTEKLEEGLPGVDLQSLTPGSGTISPTACAIPGSPVRLEQKYRARPGGSLEASSNAGPLTTNP